VDLRLINALGACVRRRHERCDGGARRIAIDTGGLPPGVYRCSVSCGTAQRTLRIVVP
jgi:hypothetical protein